MANMNPFRGDELVRAPRPTAEQLLEEMKHIPGHQDLIDAYREGHINYEQLARFHQLETGLLTRLIAAGAPIAGVAFTMAQTYAVLAPVLGAGFAASAVSALIPELLGSAFIGPYIAPAIPYLIAQGYNIYHNTRTLARLADAGYFPYGAEAAGVLLLEEIVVTPGQRPIPQTQQQTQQRIPILIETGDAQRRRPPRIIDVGRPETRIRGIIANPFTHINRHLIVERTTQQMIASIGRTPIIPNRIFIRPSPFVYGGDIFARRRRRRRRRGDRTYGLD